MKFRPKTIDYRQLKLTAEEGFVLSRVDGPVSVRDLVTLTGLPEGRIQEIVSKLTTEGALDVEGGAPAAAPSAPAAAPSAPVMRAAAPSSPGPTRPPTTSSPASPAISSRASRPDLRQEVEAKPMTEEEQLPELEELPQDLSLPPPPLEEVPFEEFPLDALPLETPSTDELAHEPATEGAADEDEKRPKKKADESDEDDVEDVAAPPEPPSAMDAEEQAQLEEEERGDKVWRRIYETIYRHMTREQRLSAAKSVIGDQLMALCLDAEPAVIFALLSNPRFGLAEARYVAFHHRTQTGLERLTRNMMILKDTLVQRRLLRNPQLPDMLLNKIVNPKLLTDCYKIAIDREIPERSRIKTANLLRKKFTMAGGEEKAALVIKTEARCLIILAGCAFDAQTTQILCGRTSWTLLSIQNLARWSATPPQLLRTLLKLPIIRTNHGMRKMLIKHPNMPSDVKRAFQTGQG